MIKTLYIGAVLIGTLCQIPAYAFKGLNPSRDTSRLSSVQQAREFLQLHSSLLQSSLWPNVEPAGFVRSLHRYLDEPLVAFENRNTNFCGYTALSFISFRRDPMAFVQFMMNLYKDGQAKMGSVNFKPGKRIRSAAGQLRYKGGLDIQPASQIWYLSLADHFKGYVNFFNRRYHTGDENTIWASTNFAKFNRMIRRLYGLNVHARGADLIRPDIDDLYSYLEKKKQHAGYIFLYLNNRLLYKKRHVTVRIGMPTHFVLLESISKDEGAINIMYMDGAKRTLQQISPDFFRKIVYGVSICTYE